MSGAHVVTWGAAVTGGQPLSPSATEAWPSLHVSGHCQSTLLGWKLGNLPPWQNGPASGLKLQTFPQGVGFSVYSVSILALCLWVGGKRLQEKLEEAGLGPSRQMSFEIRTDIPPPSFLIKKASISTFSLFVLKSKSALVLFLTRDVIGALMAMSFPSPFVLSPMSF